MCVPLKSARRRPLFTAGEKEWEIWQQRKDSGVPINDSVQKEILEVRDELGLTQYKFPWE